MSMSPKPIPLLGMGTWGMGGKFERDPSNIDASIAALQYGFELGITLVDVAEIYGAGLSEEIVGKAIAGRQREDIFIISKVWKTNLDHAGVLKAAEKSLARLETDYIDLYLVHWPNEEVPLQETMAAMEYLYSKKMIRAIGVSNFSSALMKEAQGYLTSAKLAANQIEYNLKERAAEKEIIPYAKDNDVHIIAYRPFARGILTEAGNTVVEMLAKKYNKTQNQITLNWLTTQNMTAIPKSSSHEHIKENAGALGWRLSKEDVELLRSAT